MDMDSCLIASLLNRKLLRLAFSAPRNRTYHSSSLFSSVISSLHGPLRLLYQDKSSFGGSFTVWGSSRFAVSLLPSRFTSMTVSVLTSSAAFCSWVFQTVRWVFRTCMLHASSNVYYEWPQYFCTITTFLISIITCTQHPPQNVSNHRSFISSSINMTSDASRFVWKAAWKGAPFASDSSQTERECLLFTCNRHNHFCCHFFSSNVFTIRSSRPKCMLWRMYSSFAEKLERIFFDQTYVLCLKSLDQTFRKPTTCHMLSTYLAVDLFVIFSDILFVSFSRAIATFIRYNSCSSFPTATLFLAAFSSKIHKTPCTDPEC